MNDPEPEELDQEGSSNKKVDEFKCDLCQKKDEEDVYIIFNTLYRVIVGEIFYPASKIDELSYDLEVLDNSLPPEKVKSLPDDQSSSQDKILNFRQKMSGPLLTEIIVSQQFDHLLLEIFKGKYGQLEYQNCNHDTLARYLILCFGLENQIDNDKKEKTLENIERLDSLFNSYKQLKTDIDTSQSEINNLCNHIVSKLFDQESHISPKKGNNEQDSKNDSGENASNENANDNSEKNKSFSGNGNGNGNGKSQDSTTRGTSLTRSSESHYSIDHFMNNGHDHKDSVGHILNGIQDSPARGSKGKNSINKSKLPIKATEVLKTWFLNHIRNPYPSNEAKEQLSKMTGLSKKQIQNWFTNSRKRFLEPLRKKIDGDQEEEKDDGDNHNGKANDLSHMNPPEDAFKEPPQLSQQGVANHNHNPVPEQEQNHSFIKQPNPEFIPIQRIQPLQVSSNNVMQMGQNSYQPMILQGMPYHPGENVLMLNPYSNQGQVMYQIIPMRNMIQVNNGFMPMQQSNIIMAQPHVYGGNYVMPMQNNYVEYRNVVPQNMSANYNTINNNVYNNINNMNSMESASYYPRMELASLRKGSHPELVNYEDNPDSHANLQGSKMGSIVHSKPDLDDSQFQNPKKIHKDGENS